ncbi:hypothetical protein ACOZ4I_10125 [Haloarcula salina]|uniref:hypothetical protein n=1 Tax=Haloarcula salina TaxID=1429914 RepID=UPI003C6F733C
MTQNAHGQTADALLSRIDDLLSSAERAAAGHDSVEGAIDSLDDAHDVADSVEDLLDTVDLTDLLGEIEWESLPEAIELEKVPDAIEDRNPTAAVKLRKLLSVTDMSEVWDTVDARAFWRQSRDLDDELDDFDEESDDGFFEGVSLDGPFSDDDGSGDETADEASATDGLEGLGPNDDGFDPESLENAIQSQISDSVGAFRERILEARERLKQLREANIEQSEQRHSKTSNSRNPTAVSTISSHRPRSGRAAFSTVPEETRYSTAPNRRRIYGSRFDEEDSDE